MNLQWRLAVVLVLVLCFALPVLAHVPVSAEENYDLNTSLPVENPTKSYVLYGDLYEAGDEAWYQLRMNPGDLLILSLMTPGYNASVPDLIVMSPGTNSFSEGLRELPKTFSVPQGYEATIIRGITPRNAAYEPFSPSAVFKVASYTQEITIPGIYYVAVVSPADETRYSLGVGYVEEFTPLEWILVPPGVISTHIWEGQSILAVLTPFLAVVVLGIIVIARRGKRKELHITHSSWLATIAGLCYLGGAAITLVQMVRALAVTGLSSSIALTLFFAIIPVVLGIWALRVGRSSSMRTIQERGVILLIGILGLVFWAGLNLGPVLAIGAALLPEKRERGDNRNYV